MALNLDEKQLCRSICDMYFSDRKFFSTLKQIVDMSKVEGSDKFMLNNIKVSQKLCNLIIALDADEFESIRSIDQDCWCIFRNCESIYNQHISKP